MTIGADGGGMHSLRANRSGVITVRLLKTSPVNGLLQAAFDLQRISSANWGQNTLVISDTARGEVTSGLFAAFKQFTPVTYAQDGDGGAGGNNGAAGSTPALYGGGGGGGSGNSAGAAGAPGFFRLHWEEWAV